MLGTRRSTTPIKLHKTLSAAPYAMMTPYCSRCHATLYTGCVRHADTSRGSLDARGDAHPTGW